MANVFTSAELLGKGLALPFAVNASTSEFAIVEGTDAVKASILMFLSTRRGERILNEGYGLPPVLFESIDAGFLDVIRDTMLNDFPRFEPRARVLDVKVADGEAQGGVHTVTVVTKFIVLATGQTDSVTYIVPSADRS